MSDNKNKGFLGGFGRWLLLCCIAFQTLNGSTEQAQAGRKIPEMSLYKAMLSASKEPGWVQFRNFNGRQLIYFTALQSLHCRLAEIRYSINSADLDKTFELVKCNPHMPFSLPPNANLKDIALSLPIGTASFVAVQIIWEDETESDIAVYEPCKDVGDQTCAVPAEE